MHVLFDSATPFLTLRLKKYSYNLTNVYTQLYSLWNMKRENSEK